MVTRFRRDPAPVLMRTAERLVPKCRASSATSSALASPSTGGDLSSARKVPSGCGCSALSRDRGLTFTWMTGTAARVYSRVILMVSISSPGAPSSVGLTMPSAPSASTLQLAL